MRLSKLLFSVAGLATVLVCATPGWADKIPTKRPSDYGDQDSQVQLTTPTFTTITQDGVTLSLDSVFCNSCVEGALATATNLEYFFDINLTSGSSLNSLIFGPGFDTEDPNAFSVVQFDPADAALSGDACTDGTNYLCHVPFTSNSLDFSTVTSTVNCDAVTGACTVNFTNFDFATLGGGPIVFSATTPFGVLTSLNDPVTAEPLTPSVAINGGSTVSVPEPNSFWFAVISLLACLAVMVRRQQTMASATAC